MKTIASALYAACMACAPHSSSSTMVPTNSVAIFSSTNTFVIDPSLFARTEEPRTFSEMLGSQFNQRISTYSSDSFGWQSTFGWIQSQGTGANLNALYASSYANDMRRAVLNSFRESVVRLPGALGVEDMAQGFFIGSFARTTEESVDPLRSTPSASQASWWRDMREDGSIAYGWRPFEDYLYGSARFGHWNDMPVGIALVRLHYDPILLRSTIEDQVSFFLPHSTVLLLGSSYEIISANESGRHPFSASASFAYCFDHGCLDDVIYVGMSMNDQALAGDIGLNMAF